MTSLSTSSKVPGIEEQVDPLARRELAAVVLALQTIVAAAALGAALEVREMGQRVHSYPRACPSDALLARSRRRAAGLTGTDGFYALTLWAFSQSFRNFSSPMSVSGCLNICSMTAAGHVQMSAPRRAASTMWIGPRVEATSTSVLNS